ncbi:MAG: fumarylacetoacetate hydrolase family protein [SAR324 cluster bacterium]|nr:fumarylacetoacetate hydrolase family protein [SAR324 cluster bacterium]
MSYVIATEERPALPVRGSNDLFPVRRVYCVGRNYAAHVLEMGHDLKEPPFFFQKNPDSLLASGGEFPYPSKTNNVHFEMELVVALGKGGKDIDQKNALEHIYGYAVGLDMTRRDLQGEMKKLGRPWEIGKSFDHAAPCSEIVSASECGHPNKGRIWLTVNGETRQDSDLDKMIWNIPETIEYLSGLFTLAPGDLIFTGTPEGVGPVVAGDQMHGGVDGVGEIKISVV